MPVSVEQDQEHAAGVARLKLAQPGGLDPDSLQVRVTTQQAGAERHLDPSQTGAAAWSPAERWFQGAAASKDAGGLAVELGPAATWHLKPFQPYQVAFRDNAGTLVEDRMIWAGIRLPSNPPPPVAEAGVASAGYPEQPVAEPEPEAPSEADPLAAFADMADNEPAPEPEPVEPELRAEPKPEPEPEEKKSRTTLILAVLAILLLAAAGAVWFFLLQDEEPVAEVPVSEPATETEPVTPPVVVETTQIPLTIEGARAWLRDEKPAAGPASEEAERFSEANEHQAAFLLNKYAAGQGDGQAAFRMARYYDPASHDPALNVLPEPNADIAANWYEQAAEAGEVEAMVRLGEMYKDGTLDSADAPERALFWLNKAVDAGSEKAKALIE